MRKIKVMKWRYLVKTIHNIKRCKGGLMVQDLGHKYKEMGNM